MCKAAVNAGTAAVSWESVGRASARPRKEALYTRAWEGPDLPDPNQHYEPVFLGSVTVDGWRRQESHQDQRQDICFPLGMNMLVAS